jgi:hypothetical protein
MDSYLFDQNVARCKSVQEATTYLEVFTYSVTLTVTDNDRNGLMNRRIQAGIQ